MFIPFDAKCTKHANWKHCKFISELEQREKCMHVFCESSRGLNQVNNFQKETYVTNLACIFHWRVYLCWLRQSNISIYYMFGLHRCVAAHREKVKSFFFFSWIFAELLWLCTQSLSEIGRGKQRPGSAATCQTVRCMIEDNHELKHKHPCRPSQALSPHKLDWLRSRRGGFIICPYHWR